MADSRPDPPPQDCLRDRRYTDRGAYLIALDLGVLADVSVGEVGHGGLGELSVGLRPGPRKGPSDVRGTGVLDVENRLIGDPPQPFGEADPPEPG